MGKLGQLRSVSRVLALGAHPDDLEIGAGGLLARLAAQGAEVISAVVSVPSMVSQRIEEAIRGAELLGTKLAILNKNPARVEDIPMHSLVAQLDKLVADFQPEMVITHSHQDMHWDHGLVNRATVSALRRWPCDLIAYISSYEMNAQTKSLGQCFVDITDTMDTKLAAIQAHASQLPNIDIESSRDLARAMGRIAGCSYAEAYEVLRFRL
ncbi:PIG-L family deacetylase [bacterium]|nr:MAG: PIG-L family deacetylase [bacterium]